jgi:heterotetrameric sarcosine oxidase gamma subunit
VSDNVISRSPISPIPPVQLVAGWEVSGCQSAAALTISDCSPVAKVHLCGRRIGKLADAMGVPFGRAIRKASDLIVGSEPGGWLWLGPVGAALRVVMAVEGIVVQFAAEEFASVVDLTHGLALVRISGRESLELLERLCPLDLNDDMAPDGSAFRAPVAGVATDVIRDDRDGTRSYLLQCDRSSGQYLFDTLMEAGHSFGIGVDGFKPPGI